MVNFKEWFVNNECIQDFESSLNFINLETSEAIRCTTNEEVKKIKKVGFFIYKEGRFFSILRYNNQMYFVMDNKRFNIKDLSLSFQVDEIDSETRKATIQSNDGILLELEYMRKKDIIDNWFDEDDLDFFGWLASLSNNDRLNSICL